jgi:putative transposase
VNVQGKQRYLWRAVDQDGEVVDVSLQKRRDAKAAKRFFKSLFRKHRCERRKIVTDKLRSYNVAHRELIPEAINHTTQYANNRAELSCEPTRVRKLGMRKFKSREQAQRVLGAHAAVYNLFNLGRHLVSAETYRYFRQPAFATWEKAVGI